jgi:hypothetical protein
MKILKTTKSAKTFQMKQILRKIFGKKVFEKFLKILKSRNSKKSISQMKKILCKSLKKPEHLLRGYPMEFFKMAEKL